MPTYAYRCGACEHQFEQMQRFSDDPLRECPSCGGLVRRVIQPVGIVFKGSGWYITDSRKASTDGKSEQTSDAAKTDAKSEPAATKTDGVDQKPATDATKTKADAPAKEGAKTAAD